MIRIPGGTMNTELKANDWINETYTGSEFSQEVLAECSEIEIAFAEKLLDEVQEAHDQLRNLNEDISLLQTAENALDLVTENLSRIYQMVKLHQRGNLSHSEANEINDRINNLMMVTMLVVEDTEFNGHALFKDSVIQLKGTGTKTLHVTLSRIPDIAGIETNDYETALTSLTSAAQVINSQYRRIGSALKSLLDDYRQLRNEIELLTMTKQRLAN